jgi:hypothetical protein
MDGKKLPLTSILSPQRGEAENGHARILTEALISGAGRLSSCSRGEGAGEEFVFLP